MNYTLKDLAAAGRGKRKSVKATGNASKYEGSVRAKSFALDHGIKVTSKGAKSFVGVEVFGAAKRGGKRKTHGLAARFEGLHQVVVINVFHVVAPVESANVAGRT
jgi:hypothetical protein